MGARGSAQCRARRTTLLLLLVCVAPAIPARRATIDVYCGETDSTGGTVSGSADAWLQPRANALSSRCNGVCGADSLCVFRSEPIAGCGDEQTSCVNGPTCAYECVIVLATATSWSVAWRGDGDGAPTAVAITTTLAGGEPTVSYVNGPIENLDNLELPKAVTNLSMSGPRSTAVSLVIGSGSTLLTGFSQLSTLELSNVELQDWDELPSMPALTTLTLVNTSLSKWPIAGIPDSLEHLEISYNAQLKDKLVTATFPSSVLSLSLKYCGFTKFPVSGIQALTSLNYLSLDGNSLKEIEQNALPTTLTYLDLRGNQFSFIPSVVWDLSALDDFQFQGNPVSPKIQLKKSEADWFNKLKTVGLDANTLDTESCASPTRLSHGYAVCLALTESGELASEALSTDESSGVGSGGETKQVVGMTAEQDAENRHAMLITGIVAAGILCAIVVTHVIVYRAGRTKKDTPPAAAKKNSVAKPQTSAPSSASQDANAALLKWKLEGHELVMEDEIAWGRTCAVFTAMYRGQRVVVKKLLHKARSDAEAMFLDEFRVLSQFQHAKIVQLVGVSWVKNFQKLQLVLEYMPYGDLQTYLSSIFIEKQSLQQQYFHGRWDCDGSAMKIALDIAEAITYTHTVTSVAFTKRRVLTSRQILLDDERHAKMSDFGGRHQNNNTTARWLAPEVLEGGADYNDAADVYALGVVLWELDTCDLPFAQYLPERDYGLSRVESSGEVEVLWQRVAKGELRLETLADCPSTVEQLILKCLSSESFARPSAAQVLQTLREFAATTDNSLSSTSGCSKNSSPRSTVAVLTTNRSPDSQSARGVWL